MSPSVQSPSCVRSLEFEMNPNLNSENSLMRRSWHYPILNNFDRPYQEKMVESALLQNALICLPTGFGKTFIGHVVMYNFFRWFPTRKIIFLAPTHPLVSQQFKSWCKIFYSKLNIKALEITSSMSPEKRHIAWESCGIFFTTPHILEKDIISKLFDPTSIVCLIIYEAHKATGNYSYCTIIKLLQEFEVSFRTCALTATPGSNAEAIQSIINNLSIESVEYLNELSEEIKPFVSILEKEVILFSPDPTIEICKNVLDEIIRNNYIQPLKSFRISFDNNIDNINLSSLLNTNTTNFTGAAQGFFSGLRNFLQIRDLLIFYGINPMLSYVYSFENGKSDPVRTRIYKQLKESVAFQNFILNFKQKSSLSSYVSHPKLSYLYSILEQHLINSAHQVDARAIVFSSFRDSVLDICQFLQSFSGLIRSAPLLGQSKNSLLSQKDILNRFSDGQYNVLVATCIGEEGLDLDICFLDLIIFFDAQSSPVSLVRRSEQTCLRRLGKVYTLVNEIREKNILERSESLSKISNDLMVNASQNFNFCSNLFNPISHFEIIPQIVKFNLLYVENETETSYQNLKKVENFKPSLLPKIPFFNILHSISSKIFMHRLIGHSKKTMELTKLLRFRAERNIDSARSINIWKNGINRIADYRMFDYKPIGMDDYELFYSILALDTISIFDNCQLEHAEEILPEAFFEIDDGFDGDFQALQKSKPIQSEIAKFISPDSLCLSFEEQLDDYDWSQLEF